MVGERSCALKQDDLLLELVRKLGTNNWHLISAEMHCRSTVQCMQRYSKILKPGLTKGSFRFEEDIIIKRWVKVNGPRKWTKLANELKGRTDKQCRERWMNVLDPSLKKGDWSVKEEFELFYLFELFGSKWTKIVKFIGGRTENMAKNKFYSTLRRIALKQTKLDSKTEKSLTNSQLLEFVSKAFSEKAEKLRDSLKLSEEAFNAKFMSKAYFESTLQPRIREKSQSIEQNPPKLESSCNDSLETESAVSAIVPCLAPNYNNLPEHDIFVDNDYLYFNNQIDDLFESQSVFSDFKESSEIDDFKDLLNPLDEAEEMLEISKNRLSDI